jgi:hypothetical protein
VLSYFVRRHRLQWVLVRVEVEIAAALQQENQPVLAVVAVDSLVVGCSAAQFPTSPTPIYISTAINEV